MKGIDYRKISESSNRSKPEVVTPDNIQARNSMDNHCKVYPAISVTANNAKIEGEMTKFMTTYQESLTPASLPLYFYIAYQFIQEFPEEEQKKVWLDKTNSSQSI